MKSFIFLILTIFAIRCGSQYSEMPPCLECTEKNSEKIIFRGCPLAYMLVKSSKDAEEMHWIQQEDGKTFYIKADCIKIKK